MKKLNCYSFVVGLPTDKEEDFKFVDLKMPAPSPIAAMFLRQIMIGFDKKASYKFDKDRLFAIYRKVYEYEIIETRGKTVLRFRLINIYNMSETLFRLY